MLYDEDTKEGLLRHEIKSLGAEFPGFLIVPGSVFWFKTLIRSNLRLARATRENKTKTDIRDPAKYASRPMAMPAGLAEMMEKDHPRAFDAKLLDDVHKQFVKDVTATSKQLEANDRDVRMVKNTLFSVYENNLFVYDKKYPFDTEFGLSNERFLPGHRSPQFTLPGLNLKVAVEICSDHVYGSLTLNNLKDNDIHIVVSDDVGGLCEEHFACKRGGYFVNVDRMREPTVMKNVDGRFVEVEKVVGFKSPLGGVLRLFRLDLA